MERDSLIRHQIVIVGGGFAGFWSAAAARRVGGGDVAITLVSASDSLVIRPRLYEAHPETLAVELDPLLGALDVMLVVDSALSIDFHAQTVDLRERQPLRFDRLVVAAGSVMARPSIDGASSAFSIDTQQEAIRFDHRLAEIAADATGDRRACIAIIGAGFTGIELALEMADRLAAHATPGERAESEQRRSPRVVLIDRAGVIGADLGAGPRAAITEALDAAGVERFVDASVVAIRADRVTLVDGTVIVADAVVLTTGLVAAPLVASVPGDRDNTGRIMVDRYLRAPSASNVFVAGDAASADVGDGNQTLMSCQHAMRLGRFAGENAARDLLGLPLVAYEQLRYVTCLDLGRSGAVFTTATGKA